MAEQPEQTHDPTLDTSIDMLKDASAKAKEDLDDFIGADTSVSGKFDENLSKSEEERNGKKLSKTNKDRDDVVKHIEQASDLTGAGEFNHQNFWLKTLGALLALLLLAPLTTYIMIYDLNNIAPEFKEFYPTHMFTITIIIFAISLIMLGLTEYLFLGQFNERNKETRKLERGILFLLLFIQLGTHTYFAYLITGTTNEDKKVKIISSTTTAEGVEAKDLTESIDSTKMQIDDLQKELKENRADYKAEKAKRDSYESQWKVLNDLSSPSRSQQTKRRNFYTLKKDCQKNMDNLTKRKKEISDELSSLQSSKRELSKDKKKIIQGVDKDLKDSGILRIIYTMALLFLFEGLSHIHWLAFYRIIKNAPPDQRHDWREMASVLNFGKLFADKVQEAISVVAGQQVKLADDQLNNIKMTGKAFEYQMAGNSAVMIENTKGNVAATKASVESMKQNTKGIILLARTIQQGTKELDLEYKRELGYEERDDKMKVQHNLPSQIFVPPPPSLSAGLEYLSNMFEPIDKPTLRLEVGKTGGYCDVITNQITIGQDEPEKLTVLAHEFTHTLGFIQHDQEFRELEATMIKGLETWLRQTQQQ